jgi:hypothetical protein
MNITNRPFFPENVSGEIMPPDTTSGKLKWGKDVFSFSIVELVSDIFSAPFIQEGAMAYICPGGNPSYGFNFREGIFPRFPRPRK